MYLSSRKSTKILVFLVLKFFIEGGVTMTIYLAFLTWNLPWQYEFFSVTITYFFSCWSWKLLGRLLKYYRFSWLKFCIFYNDETCFIFQFIFLRLVESMFFLRIGPKFFSSCTITIPLAKYDRIHGDTYLSRITNTRQILNIRLH